MPSKKKHVALILAEGETETEFYNALANLKFKSISKRIKDLEGNFSINKKIVAKSYNFSLNNPGVGFDVYVCIDQEKIGIPAYNRKLVEAKLKELSGFRNLHDVICVLMMESIFFIDIDGIYDFLKVPQNRRDPQRFKNFRNLSHKDLSNLFNKFGQTYAKGIKCKDLIEHLDMDKIIEDADEIKYMIENITKN